MRKSHLATSCAVLAGLSLGQSQVAFGGVSGSMNGAGFGQANANVVFGVTSKASIITQSPSAAIKQTAGFTAFAPLPPNTPAGTTAQIKGSPGYVWFATSSASGGATADNEAIQSMTDVTPAPAASLLITTGVTVDDQGRRLDFDGFATDGTAVLFQVFEKNSQTTTQSDANSGFNGFTPEEILFSQLHLGDGALPLPGAPIPTETTFHFSFYLPKGVPDTDIIVQIDGLASSIPDSGCIGLAFALTVGGLIYTRRLIAPPTTAS